MSSRCIGLEILTISADIPGPQMVLPHNGDQDPERPAALLVSCKCSMKNQCWENCMQKKKNGPLVADRVSPIIISRSM